ncbi:zinc finger protein Xfin-like [Galleria mellonella]|uniref:Zinc finger protein Xfin-like n=1 Tax=Galleria mellonella TaxID=7137 RepID=A0A6J1WYZ8_GALME|nr:zinc finger protein Xfin-like [Galleria mellonella]
MAKQNESKRGKKRIEKNFCEYCNKILLGSSYKFKIHMYQHSTVRPLYHCKLCNKGLSRKDALKRHMDAHTGNTRKYICDYCDRDFVDKRNLISHLWIHEDNQNSQKSPKKRHTCLACGVYYCEERLLKFHIRKEHFNLTTPTPSNIHEKKLNDTWVERVSESETYVQMTKVNNNIITIKKCDSLTAKELCDTEFKIKDKGVTEYYDAYAHFLACKRADSQYTKAICDYCNKEMLKKSLLAHIRERHLNIRKYKCETCQFSFKRHYLFVEHACGKSRRRRPKRQVIS